jgi:2-C-methyl-D-erythritol 4-phosphate cytidylyltransferase
MQIVDGGETRQQSMRNGLSAVDQATDLVLVHDAARPLLPVPPTRSRITSSSGWPRSRSAST